MNWQDLGGALIKAGAPILGNALGGPLGGMIGDAIGGVLANALGVDARGGRPCDQHDAGRRARCQAVGRRGRSRGNVAGAAENREGACGSRRNRQ